MMRRACPSNSLDKCRNLFPLQVYLFRCLFKIMHNFNPLINKPLANNMVGAFLKIECLPALFAIVLLFSFFIAIFANKIDCFFIAIFAKIYRKICFNTSAFACSLYAPHSAAFLPYWKKNIWI